MIVPNVQGSWWLRVLLCEGKGGGGGGGEGGGVEERSCFF